MNLINKGVALLYANRKRFLTSFLLLFPTLFLLWIISFGYKYAYDADLYLQTISKYRLEGFWSIPQMVGYRAYLFPYFFSLFPKELSHFMPIGGMHVAYYSLVSVSILLISEFIALCALWKRKAFWIFYVAIFLNPLLLIYIPYPLQESFIMLTLALMLPLMVYAKEVKKLHLFVGLLGLTMGILYMTRSSHILFLVPALLIVLWVMRKVTWKKRATLSLVFVMSFIVLIVPQSVLMWKSFKTVNPYPQTEVLTNQLKWGSVFAKYGTNISGATHIAPPMPYWNPLICKSTTDAPFSRRSFHCDSNTAPIYKGFSQENIFKVLIHTFNALNYDVLKPYILMAKPPIFSFVQFLSMLVVFLGGYATIRKWVWRTYKPLDLFLDGLLIGTLAVTALVAVETRFGLLATLVLSLRAVELWTYKIEKQELLPIIVGAVCFMIIAALLSVYVLTLSGALIV